MAISTIGVSAGGGLQPYEKIFTTSGIWTKPTGVKTCEVTVVGGAGGGWAGGAGVVKRIVDVSNLSNIPITVGAGGSTYSVNGGYSAFGTLVTAGGSPGTSSGQYGQMTGAELDLTRWGTAGVAYGSGVSMVNEGVGTSYSNIAVTATNELFCFWRDGNSGQIINVFSGVDGSNKTLRYPTNRTMNKWKMNIIHKSGVYLATGNAGNVLYYYNGTSIPSSGTPTLTEVTVGAANFDGRIATDGTYFYAVDSQYKCWRSSNAQTWTEIGTVSNAGYNVANHGLIVDAAGRLVVIFSNGRISISANQGATWSFVDTTTIYNQFGSNNDNNWKLYLAKGKLWVALETGTLWYMGTFAVSDTTLTSFTNYFGVNHAGSSYGHQLVNQLGDEEFWFMQTYSNSYGWITWAFDPGVQTSQITIAGTGGLISNSYEGSMGGIGSFVLKFGHPQTSSNYATTVLGTKELPFTKIIDGSGAYSPGAGGTGYQGYNNFTMGGQGIDSYGQGIGSGQNVSKSTWGSATKSAVGTQGAVIIRWWA